MMLVIACLLLSVATEEYSPSGTVQTVNGVRYIADGSGWLIREPATEALGEVNAARAARGLPPFAFDARLTAAAQGAAKFRADRLIEGHTSNGFAFVPTGGACDAAGCAAWPPHLGWGSCCAYEAYRSAGAAWSMGSDGRRYMHLFMRR